MKKKIIKENPEDLWEAEEIVEEDLANGMFYKICSNETTFREYVYRIISHTREKCRLEVGKVRRE